MRQCEQRPGKNALSFGILRRGVPARKVLWVATVQEGGILMQARVEEAGNGGALRGIVLPEAPVELTGAVKAWREDVEILTYEPARPDRNPMFLEKRVYQGSNGGVYPLPFIDRIATEPVGKRWRAIHIENEYLRLMILPEIGGRIHIGYDKTTGYDFFYRQNVIKPALVGLAGPWISGGVEFNWPQHHRPATFMPVETEIETGPDGSVTVWCSDHDPMLRMKGMHGVCLRPGRAVLELKVRLFNRTPWTQTFLWWANVAARVHEQYQSFFPTDVRFVADHARRAMTSFPLSGGSYYGVDYGERARSGVPGEEQPQAFVPEGGYAPNDLSWYANIPVPTSYMVTGTREDFFGGYDHRAGAGVVHVANHHIAPGKKQWTWGNHEFGYAWDRSLTDADGPYIELMAGVYTDNQPDFSYLAPWETKSFTQSWYPIRGIGPAQAATLEAALSLEVQEGAARIGVCVTAAVAEATVRLMCGETELYRAVRGIAVAEPLVVRIALPAGSDVGALRVAVEAEGRTLVAYDPANMVPAKEPTVATEPAAPEEMATVEELYLTGVHLEQYRHATRRPEVYWQEALRRDAGESRVHNALGLWRLRRGELELAADHFEAAIRRLTGLNGNPRDGEAFYNLGLTRRYQGRDGEAYEAFYKATWNAEWRGPGYFALAEMDAAKKEWVKAREHLERSLRAEADNLSARNLLARVLEKAGLPEAALEVWEGIRATDAMEIGARWRMGIAPADGQQRLDLAFDLERAGLLEEAAEVLATADVEAGDGSVPMILLALGEVQRRLGRAEAEATDARVGRAGLEYCFPSRVEELLLLERAVARDAGNGVAWYLLGNQLYSLRRHEAAIEAWEAAARLLPELATVWRNLGIAYLNVRGDEGKALAAFDRAVEADAGDARLVYERDQLWKRVGVKPEARLVELERHLVLIGLRDDLTVELATLLNQTGQVERALEVLLGRKFQPWEGGEGLVLAQYVRARLTLGRRALRRGDGAWAEREFLAALELPQSLGEAWHLHANRNEIFYWLGEACESRGDAEAAATWWRRATRTMGDFQQMAVQSVSEMTYWSGQAWRRLGDDAAAEGVFRRISAYAAELEKAEAKVDYFATSLPTMLLFEEDLGKRKTVQAEFLRAQALVGLGEVAAAEATLGKVLAMEANHAGAADLLEQVG